MKICLLNDSFPPVIDGVANVVMNYARIMTENKNDVIVATPRYPGADYTGYTYPVVTYRSIDTTQIVNGYRAGYPLSVSATGKLKEFGPDIIHTHCPVSSTVLARLLKNETDAPVIFTYHTKFDFDIASAVKAQFLRDEVARIMVDNISACDEVWTVSRGAGENLKSLGYKGDYRVVSNGVDFAKGKVSQEEVEAVRAPYDIPEDVPIFLFVGRLMKYKGLPIIVDALGKLSKEGKDFRMIFVGGGTDAKEMQQRSVENGLSVDIRDEDGIIKTLSSSENPGKAIFTGPEHDREVLRAWNTLADLFLFPSTYDTNGIVVREAAACGLASVLIMDSCAAEGIEDGRNGYIIEENADSMAALLSRIGNDRKALKETGMHAMDEIYISWDEAVSDALKRYAEVIDLKRSGKLVHAKKEPSDHLMSAAATLIDGTRKVFDVSRDIKEGMMENMSEVREELRYEYTEIQEKYDDLKKNTAEKTEKIKQKGRDMKEKLEEDLQTAYELKGRI
ncbi:MAG: glycosyltransferase [Lachnospiraceae bacterium]|nr:glycosyltransferase [Lachnospiraceae bacterium]